MSPPEKQITILINQKPFHVTSSSLTGKEIKELANEPLEKLLVKVVEAPDPVAGGDDIIIGNDDTVELKSGMRFRIVNAATFG
ncbi:MAG: multiubiquitin domain-containing protein [Nitrosarchaeum sp.]|nr:multiubiquitin domain-containing protein [Nitrosarchaeum sp.]